MMGGAKPEEPVTLTIHPIAARMLVLAALRDIRGLPLTDRQRALLDAAHLLRSGPPTTPGMNPSDPGWEAHLAAVKARRAAEGRACSEPDDENEMAGREAMGEREAR